MKAFITGSRAYGKTPTKTTDVDLVIFCDPETAAALTELSDLGKEPVKYGLLNLIICTSEEEWAAWRIATTGMVAERAATETPISKYKAADTIDAALALAQLPPRHGPSERR